MLRNAAALQFNLPFDDCWLRSVTAYLDPVFLLISSDLKSLGLLSTPGIKSQVSKNPDTQA